MMHVYSDNNLLIADIRNGKHEAYEYLFATYYPRLHNYALCFLADGDAVGDIIQDCFMKLWEKRGELILQSVDALLFRMVRNQCLNYLRHKALEDSEWLQSLNLEDHSERLYSTDFLDDPDQELLFQELKRQAEHFQRPAGAVAPDIHNEPIRRYEEPRDSRRAGHFRQSGGAAHRQGVENVPPTAAQRAAARRATHPHGLAHAVGVVVK